MRLALLDLTSAFRLSPIMARHCEVSFIDYRAVFRGLSLYLCSVFFHWLYRGSVRVVYRQYVLGTVYMMSRVGGVSCIAVSQARCGCFATVHVGYFICIITLVMTRVCVATLHAIYMRPLGGGGWWGEGLV